VKTLEQFKEFILANRSNLIERDVFDRESGQSVRGTYFRFNHALPIFRDGKVQSSKCPAERVSDGANGLNIFWSDEKQTAFETELTKCGFNWNRFTEVVTTYRNHWQNIKQTWSLPEVVRNADPVYFLEPYHPGITGVLHELGKSPLFNSLQEVSSPALIVMEIIRNEDGSTQIQKTYPNQEIDEWEYLFVEGDEISKKYTKKLQTSYRARMIASRGMIEWTSKNALFEDWELLKCSFCAEMFWPQLLSGTEIGKYGYPRYCINCCDLRRDIWHLPAMSIGDRRINAIRALQLSYEITNVFPAQAVKKETIAHLSDEARDDWMIAQILLPGDSYKELFGTWNDLLAASGLLEKKPRAGKGGYVTKSACGHICLSLAERRICDELFNLGIDHEKEPKYPTHVEYNPNGKLRGDWKIGECFVEFAGYMDDANYKKNMEKKQLLANISNIQLMVLLPTDIRNISSLLSDSFSKTD
jgi:hypothetical protein